MKVSCALAPGLSTPDRIALAEQLGFHRAWCFDSPALYADTWMTLARAADRTSTIGLGPAVLVPTLRHVMTTAAAVATLAVLAPGRTAVVLGSGFSGRLVLGQKAMRWSDLARSPTPIRLYCNGIGHDALTRSLPTSHAVPKQIRARRIPFGVATLDGSPPLA